MGKSKSVLALLVFVILFVLASEVCAANYYFPRAIFLGDSNRREITESFKVNSGTSMSFHIYAADYNEDHFITVDDYEMYYMINGTLNSNVTQEKPGTINIRLSTNSIVEAIKYDPKFDFLKSLGKIDVTFMNLALDTDNSNGGEAYNDVIGSFIITIDPDGTGVSPIRTKPLTAVVLADNGTGKGGDNGGGSCDALGLGILSLALPLLFSLRKKRS
ncbi:hypothetical protein AGMMS50276_13160 [Synergistales bacterium]|nr:hypothetical protein AGMMS50276_13160 [Synergistales bacterium]